MKILLSLESDQEIEIEDTKKETENSNLLIDHCMAPLIKNEV